MNGKQSKALRRAIYGEQSLRQPRRYLRWNNGEGPNHEKPFPGTIQNHPRSLRARYQRAKRSV